MATDDAARPSASARTSRVEPDEVIIVPANQASWPELQAVFGSRGDARRCWCQRFRMGPGETWSSEGPDELGARLREQTGCGRPDALTTTGLVAFVDEVPVGWCAVAPRSDHARMLRNNRVPWDGRDEDKHDPTVWVMSCFVTRAGYGRLGISHALARAAVDFVRARGARAIEGYPDLVEGGYVGTRETFAQAGLVEVHQPSTRKLVMRLDF